jgi:hypothetical protein
LITKQPAKKNTFWKITALIMLGLGLLEIFSYSKYHIHLPKLIQLGVDFDIRHKGWELKNYSEENIENPYDVKDTIKVEMTQVDFAAMNDEWLEFYKNKHQLDGSPWVEKKGKYSASVKHINGDEKWHKAKISMVGMWTDHHPNLQRFSMKLKLSGENRMFGSKAVNLILPETRSIIIDPLANELYKSMFNGMALQYNPVIVQFRKNQPVLMLREENFDKFLIERNRKRESVIFEKGFAGGLKHLPGYEKESPQGDFNYEFPDSTRQAALKNTLWRHFNHPTDTLFEMVDKEKFLGMLSIGIFFKSWHHLVDINLHWYYNPVNHKLEPLIREVGMYPEFGFKTEIKSANDRMKHYQFQFDYFHKEIAHGLPNFIHSYTQYLKKTDPNYLHKLDQNVLKVALAVQQKINQYPYQKPYELLPARFQQAQKGILDVLQMRYTELLKVPTQNYREESQFTSNNIIRWKNKVVINEKGYTLHENQTLIIEPGTKILLSGKKCVVKLLGNTQAIGTLNQPISWLVAQQTNGSLFIQNQGKLQLTHCIFDGFSSLSDGIWSTPAGITIHESNHAQIHFCQFKNNRKGDDMLNLFGCNNFNMWQCTFENILSDAFDSDFSTGIVHQCRFNKIGNDGVDGSGSNITVKNSHFNYVQDKAISSGEKSKFIAQHNTIDSCAIAFVSKDLSVLKETSNTLSNNQLDYAAFVKKPEYGPASLVSDQDLTTKKYLFQRKSIIKHRGKKTVMIKDVESKLYGNEFGRATQK